MPLPKSIKISASELQLKILTNISRQTTSSVREVSRSRMILAMLSGLANTKVASTLGVTQEQAKRWRLRWHSFENAFLAVETKGGDHLLLNMERKIRECLSDAPRSGAPFTFSAEQYCQIVAISLEDPMESSRPVTEWTPREIAAEAVKRGIVSSISESQVRSFLKSKRC
jgi:putative transposase